MAVGFCPVGFCPVGFCPSGVLSQWGFVRSPDLRHELVITWEVFSNEDMLYSYLV